MSSSRRVSREWVSSSSLQPPVAGLLAENHLFLAPLHVDQKTSYLGDAYGQQQLDSAYQENAGAIGRLPAELDQKEQT